MRAGTIGLVLLICAVTAACGKKSSLYLEPGKQAAPKREEPVSRPKPADAPSRPSPSESQPQR